MKVLRVIYSVVVLAAVVECKLYSSKCSLFSDLAKNNMQMHFMKTWICLADRLSAMNTSYIKTDARKGISYYGIFQIDNKKWCKEGRRGGECNLDCNSLLDDKIGDDCECARKIQNSQGFKHWNDAFFKYCKGVLEKPNIAECPDYSNIFSRSRMKRTAISYNERSDSTYGLNFY